MWSMLSQTSSTKRAKPLRMTYSTTTCGACGLAQLAPKQWMLGLLATRAAMEWLLVSSTQVSKDVTFTAWFLLSLSAVAIPFPTTAVTCGTGCRAACCRVCCCLCWIWCPWYGICQSRCIVLLLLLVMTYRPMVFQPLCFSSYSVYTHFGCTHLKTCNLSPSNNKPAGLLCCRCSN
jgi:hypothetical protein